ncbi:hypothetical protein FRB93_013543 [Tulasnella sp. JGI-2019a]|nr:hypothetical protein FRB93_013543 [Tulasnella sp. JGI-2019a]
MSEVPATTPAVVAPPTAPSDATKPAVAAPSSETPSKADAPPSSTKPSNKPGAKEPGPTAASLLAPQRYIPGAPPPEPPKVKALRQKKPKKEKKDDAGGVEVPDAHSAALTDKAPGQQDIESGKVAQELVADEDEIDALLKEDEEKEEKEKGATPAVLAVEKKIKNLQERILRAKKYSDTPDKELDKDQKVLKANLPTLEATIKEMSEVKIAVQNYEAKHDVINQAEKKQRKQEELTRQRQAIREHLNNYESKTIAKVRTVLAFLSLSSSLTEPSSSRPFVAAMDELDRAAITKAAEILLGEELTGKEQVINGLINDKSIGEVEGVPFKRLRELATNFARPLSPEPSADAPLIPANGASMANQAAATSAAGAGMTFTTDSELEQPRALQFGALDEVSGMGTNDLRDNGGVDQALSQSIEIVEGSSIPSAHAVQQEWVEVEKDDGQTERGQAETGAIDWAADDEGELPSIDSLNAKFGTSGDATPIETPSASTMLPNAWPITPEVDEGSLTIVNPAAAAESNTRLTAAARGVAPEDDGWTPAQGTRGAPGHSGRGGFQHRGGDGFRGGDRGGSGFRGRGRGRGEFRGGFRGEHRGGGGGGFGSGWRPPANANGGAEGAPEGEGWTRQEGARGGRGGGFERGRGRGEWRGDGERRGRGGGTCPHPISSCRTTRTNDSS